MKTQKIQLLFSLIFVIGYFSLLFTILLIEVNDELNMESGENSMMGELQILLGVLTAGLAQILNFWFNTNTSKEETEKKVG